MADHFTPRVKSLLLQNGCVFVRHGKGDHEIWIKSDQRAAFHGRQQHQIEALGANYTLKQAGIAKAF